MAYQSRLELAVDSRSGEQSLRRFRGELDQTERRGTHTFGNLKKLALGFTGILGTIGATRYFRTMLNEQMEVQQNLLRTTQLLETTGAAAWTTADALDAQARGLARATLQSTAGVQRAQQVMMTFRSVTGDTFTQAIDLAADLATVMGGDITSATQQLGRALEDPERGITALRRSGVSFTEAQQDLIKSLMETNRLAEAQAIILNELAGQVGGVARREAESLAGAFDTLGQANQEAREALANYFDLVDRSTGLVNSLADSVDNFTDRLASGELDTHIRQLQAIGTVVGTAAAGYAAYRTALVAATAAQWAFNAAVTANPLGILAVGLTTVVAGLGAMGAALDDSAERAANMEFRAKELANSLQAMGEASIRTQLAAVTLELAQMEGAQERLAETSRRHSRESGFLAGSVQDIRDSIDAATQAAGTSTEELEKMRTQQMALERALELVTTSSDAAGSSIEEFGGIATGTASELRALQREADEFARSLLALQDQLFPIEAAQRQYRQEQELLSRAYREGALDADRYAESLERLERLRGTTDANWQDVLGFTGSGAQAQEQDDYWERWLEGAQSAMTDFDQLAANTFDRFSAASGQAFESMIFDSQSAGEAMRGLADTMLRSIVRALGEMAAQWVAYQAVQMALGRSSEAAAVAGATVAGTSMAAAYAPAAAMASLASFGANAAPAMAGISSTAALAQGLAITGMAHDGIDRIPREGTWLLDKGERVMNRPQADRLDGYLDQQQRKDRERDGARVTVNLIEDAERAGSVEQESGTDDEEIINVFVANIASGGDAARAIEATYGVSRQGR